MRKFIYFVLGSQIFGIKFDTEYGETIIYSFIQSLFSLLCGRPFNKDWKYSAFMVWAKSVLW